MIDGNTTNIICIHPNPSYHKSQEPAMINLDSIKFTSPLHSDTKSIIAVPEDRKTSRFNAS